MSRCPCPPSGQLAAFRRHDRLGSDSFWPDRCLWQLRQILSLSMARVWLVPVAWVGLEYYWPKVFPWVFAHSQTDVLPLLQIAEFVGGGGVSFCLFSITIFPAAFSCLRSRPSNRIERQIRHRIRCGVCSTTHRKSLAFGPSAYSTGKRSRPLGHGSESPLSRSIPVSLIPLKKCVPERYPCTRTSIWRAGPSRRWVFITSVC